jgi:uncharacterized protein YndB with AHSA1/START domain
MSRSYGYRLPNMTTSEPSISVSRDVDAPCDKVFDYLARPANQVTIDGSGMLRGTADDRILSRVGETFEMEMHNDRFGDYVVENRVVEYEPSRRIAWMPVLKSVAQPDSEVQLGVPAHNVWGWKLSPLPGGGARVTEFFDCSASPSGCARPPTKARTGGPPSRPAWQTWRGCSPTRPHKSLRNQGQPV